MDRKQQHLEPNLSSLKEEIDSLHAVVDTLFRKIVEAERAAAYDDLTGCLRRNSFFTRGEEIVSQNKESYFILCDIDHFKKINDQYGHQMGDQVLREFSSILRQNVDSSGVVGRLGGEEFAIVLPKNEEGCVELAEKIRQAVEATKFSVGSTSINVTVSMGLTRITTVQSSFAIADEKLYQAKNEGRNKICA